MMMKVFRYLQNTGVVVDERKPDVIRVAPVPIYNSFEDCWLFVQALKQAMA
jgi:kynureninase